MRQNASGKSSKRISHRQTLARLRYERRKILHRTEQANDGSGAGGGGFVRRPLFAVGVLFPAGLVPKLALFARLARQRLNVRANKPRRRRHDREARQRARKTL